MLRASKASQLMHSKNWVSMVGRQRKCGVCWIIVDMITTMIYDQALERFPISRPPTTRNLYFHRLLAYYE